MFEWSEAIIGGKKTLFFIARPCRFNNAPTQPSSPTDQTSARRIPVDWPREAEEKRDQNEKLSERSEFLHSAFFEHRRIRACPGKGQANRRGRLFWVTFLAKQKR